MFHFGYNCWFCVSLKCYMWSLFSSHDLCDVNWVEYEIVMAHSELAWLLLSTNWAEPFFEPFRYRLLWLKQHIHQYMHTQLLSCYNWCSEFQLFWLILIQLPLYILEVIWQLNWRSHNLDRWCDDRFTSWQIVSWKWHSRSISYRVYENLTEWPNFVINSVSSGSCKRDQC